MHPLLDKIQKLDNQVKIYALNGVAMAFANEIEDTMFWSYVAASGQSFEVAARHFYQSVKFKNKQDSTDEAISKKFESTLHLKTWKALNARIQSLLGEGNSLRNLIGHNSVSINVYVSADTCPDDELIEIEIRHEVQQKAAMVKVRRRSKMTVGEPELTEYCGKLISLYLDLEHFAENILKFGSTNPERYSHGV